MSRFYRLDLLGDEDDDDLAFIDEFADGDGFAMEHYRMSLGKPALSIWPRDAFVEIRKGGGRRLLDLVGVTTSQITVSARFADIIKRHLTAQDVVEFLPIAIKDSRNRVLSTSYFVVNPIGTVDCLDLEASEIINDPDEPDVVMRVKTPVLAGAKLKEPKVLFRIREAPTSYVLASPLAIALYDGGVTNLYWDRLEVR